MTQKIAIELGNVQKTLVLPLWGRAVESQKEHPELVDKTAVEIMKKVDYDFSPITARPVQLVENSLHRPPQDRWEVISSNP